MSFAEPDDVLIERSKTGAEIRNHELHHGNSGALAASSMRRSIVLTNGASNAAHESNSATGMLFFPYSISDLICVDCLMVFVVV